MALDVNLNVTVSPSDQPPAWAKQLLTMVGNITNKENSIMVTLQDIQAKAAEELARVTAETDVVNAVKTVVENQNTKLDDLKKQIDALVASGASPEQLQQLSDTIDQIRTLDTANAAVVAAAVAAGTPMENPSPAAPPADQAAPPADQAAPPANPDQSGNPTG